jgi:ABC-type bacteriocin/lantibiotic exporter with double-glycine peptidase domain
MTIVTQGVPATVPDGLQAMSGPQVRTDLERPLASSTQTIGLLDALLLVVAAGIIGSILYLSALERVRDFAVLKATGASNRALLAGLALQALLLAAAAALMAELEIRDLTVQYASGGYVVRPIDGLDLQVPSGELVLLLGASGSGKTTLLSVLAGILTPSAGTIRFGDVEVTGLRGAALTNYRRHTVGIVFQSFNLVPA